jgi:hypothetical protein
MVEGAAPSSKRNVLTCVCPLLLPLLLLLPRYALPQMRVYDDDSEESKHRKEEIAALGASNPTAVYRCGSSSGDAC